MTETPTEGQNLYISLEDTSQTTKDASQSNAADFPTICSMLLTEGIKRGENIAHGNINAMAERVRNGLTGPLGYLQMARRALDSGDLLAAQKFCQKVEESLRTCVGYFDSLDNEEGRNPVALAYDPDTGRPELVILNFLKSPSSNGSNHSS